MNAVFLAMTLLLALIAGYWLIGRRAPRPAGASAVCALLACCALAFLAYTPPVMHAVDGVVPQLSRLMSNSASVGATTSAVAAPFQMNLSGEEARRRIRLRLAIAAAVLAGMTGLFLWEVLVAPSGRAYALYLGLFISYFSVALADFMWQAVRQSKSTHRGSVCLGLRLAATGCFFGLIYAGYKMIVLVSLGLKLNLVGRDKPSCTSLISLQCAFTVSAPALAVLLISVGLTLPAVVYPISLSRRRRWENRSFVALGPLWGALAAAMPHIVLRELEDDGMNDDAGFLLQRRVVEISDGLLELRPYRPQDVLDVARERVDTGTRAGAAFAEAALTKAALAGLRSDRQPDDVAPPELFLRDGDLRAETDWLVAVAGAYVRSGTFLAADVLTAPVGG